MAFSCAALTVAMTSSSICAAVSAEQARVVSPADDGMTQRVTARSGISLVKQVSVPNPVVLAPYRTFTEVEQPKSPFVFRIRQTGDEVQAALFAADADAWKREAIANIRDWFEQHIPQDLREDVIILA